MDKMPEALRQKLKDGLVMFTVNEEGKVINARISKTSGDQSVDQLLLEGINKMPQWKPGMQAGKAVDLRPHARLEFNGARRDALRQPAAGGG